MLFSLRARTPEHPPAVQRRGSEVLQLLIEGVTSKNPSTQQTYAVILTAMSEWELRTYKSNAEKLGVDAFLSKPLRLEALRDLVSKVRSQEVGAIEKPKIQNER
jgi:response regulator RpfG family c-di-GMP phosphodiesterase